MDNLPGLTQKGAEYLDKHLPGWRDKITPQGFVPVDTKIFEFCMAIDKIAKQIRKIKSLTTIEKIRYDRYLHTKYRRLK